MKYRNLFIDIRTVAYSLLGKGLEQVRGSIRKFMALKIGKILD